MSWAAWVAVAAIAGLVTFVLLRRPPETEPLSLTPIVVASTRVPETPMAPVVEDAVDDATNDAVEPPAAFEEPTPSPMRSPMRAVVRMTQATPTPTMSVAAAMEAPTPMPAMSAMADTGLPETPSRAEVQSALLAVRGNVRECMSRGGRVPVRVTVSGRTGRVTTASVQDAYFARQPTGGCIARAVRGARFPRFQQERLVVVYPYEF